MYLNNKGLQVTFDDGPFVNLPDPFNPNIEITYMNPAFTNVDEMGSFEEYCSGHYSAGWIGTLYDMILEKKIDIGIESRVVGVPDIQRLDNADIVRIEFSRLDRERICIDAVVAAEIIVYRKERHDLLKQWFRIRNTLEIYGDSFSVETENISIYDKRDAKPGLSLSEYLIPVLNAEEIEDEADGLLLRYYPEALATPMAVDGELLAKRMGLTIVDVPLDSEIMGQSVFYDETVTVGEYGHRKELKVKAGTILVNAGRGMTKAQRNVTIIHECSHHHEHDLFVWAQRLYNEEISGLDCSVNAARKTEGRHTPLYWTEQQANRMTYRVMMNRLQTRAEIQRLMAEYERSDGRKDMGREMEWVVHRIADRFHTSREIARKRMAELGFTRVGGVMNYINGGYVPPFFFRDGALEKNQTFVVGVKEAAVEFGRNSAFRQTVENGFYAYVEGKFCLNQSKYVRVGTDGVLRMTDYGRTHTDECCLRFDISYRGDMPKYVPGRLHRTGGDGKTILFPQSVKPEVGRELTEMVEWATAVNKATAAMDFAESLRYLMTERKITVEELEEKAHISVSTIKRLRGGVGQSVTKELVVALAVGLRLPPMVSMELMRKAGHILTNSTVQNTYGMILCVMFTADITTVNAYLASQGISPLTNMAAAI